MLSAQHLLGSDSDLKHKAELNEARLGHIPGCVAGAGHSGQGIVAVLQNHAPHAGGVCRTIQEKGL